MTWIRQKAKDMYRRMAAFTRKHARYIILSGLLLGIFAGVFFHRIVILIYPGELGVLWRCLGGGTQMDTVYREGVHFVLPINKMYIYNVRRQVFSDTISVLTVDGLTVTVRYTARYYLEKDPLPMLHQRVGQDYVNVLVKPEVRSVIRTVFGQYKPEEIYTSQRAIQERVTTLSKVLLSARFMALDEVPIESIALPTRISEAIEAKMGQQQVQQEYDYRLVVAKLEAERRSIESTGIRQYNETIGKSLSPSVLAWHGIQATQDLAKSPNAKTIVVGAGKNGLPLILGKD